jgi:SAM-dependent methyltransferase
MQPLLYGELVPWYRLIDPPEDHEEEAACYREAFERDLRLGPATLLDLGCGGGHNALHLKGRFQTMLTDISEAMVGLSRELNPECEHLIGDLRTLRLGRTFDAVLVHDAVMYMTTEAELAAAAATAFVHTRPGGAAIFAPDTMLDTFRESSSLIAGQDETRALRGIQWAWDPDASDTTHRVEYSFLLREHGQVQAVHDTHTEGLFPRATWLRVLQGAGYRVEPISRPIGDGAFDEIFLCRRPEG